jgi:hypothetical protein
MAVTSPGGHAAGVLLYRIMSVKILVTIAWVGYQYLQDRARGRNRCAPCDAVIFGRTEPRRVQAARA